MRLFRVDDPHNSRDENEDVAVPLFPLNVKKVQICEIMSGRLTVKIQQCVKIFGGFS